ncbi:hypothetical protein MYSTI_00398 [Myxococcus stipitatus DSM 14675]|uniref:Uncharacterized protein n=1 Tax=Myxococcus stipitatus (strain DSM 14675 / JCM 12634 / Mx s8) TaxID=1278073 RepID=L7TZ09_MYXSD|nr:hypothetical protein [Myxococcus stipitatus]AGC41756.1 hypothetical protein MYSTI_00398 [Myxococcus stipitatus DSM 14675]
MKTPLPLALAGLLAYAGCSGDSPHTPCSENVAVPPEAVQRSGTLVFPVDSVVEFRVNVAELTQDCDTDAPIPQWPTSATAQVFDPEGLPIPVEVTWDVMNAVPRLTFTPSAVGRHHALVAFTPVGGIRQFGIHMASPWSGAPTPVTLPLPRCAQLDRTSRGLWLCDGVALRDPAAAPLRLGSATTPPDVAVWGNVVWVLGDGRLRRYVDTGTELELTGSLLLSTTEAVKVIQSRLASENELVVMDNQTLHRFVFTNTGVLEAPPPTRWAPTSPLLTFSVDNAVGLLVRTSPDQVLTVSMTAANDSEACPYSLQSNGSYARATATPCTPLRGRPVGLEEGVVWTHAEVRSQVAPSPVLRRWEAAEGRLVEQASLVMDGRLTVLPTPLRTGLTVPSFPAELDHVAVPRSSPPRPTLTLELVPSTLLRTRENRLTHPGFHWGGDSRPATGTTIVYEQTRPHP